MPNWCENVVNLYGDNEDLQKFRKECISKNEKGWEYVCDVNDLEEIKTKSNKKSKK